MHAGDHAQKPGQATRKAGRKARVFGRTALSTLLGVATAAPIVAVPFSMHAQAFADTMPAAATANTSESLMKSDETSWQQGGLIYPQYQAGTTYGSTGQDADVEVVSHPDITISFYYAEDEDAAKYYPKKTAGYHMYFTISDPESFVQPSGSNTSVVLTSPSLYGRDVTARRVSYNSARTSSSTIVDGTLSGGSGSITSFYGQSATIGQGTSSNSDCSVDDDSYDSRVDWCIPANQGLQITFVDPVVAKDSVLGFSVLKQGADGQNKTRYTMASSPRLWTLFSRAVNEYFESSKGKISEEFKPEVVDKIQEAFANVLAAEESPSSDEALETLGDMHLVLDASESKGDEKLKNVGTTKAVLGQLIDVSNIESATAAELRQKVATLTADSTISDISKITQTVSEKMDTAEEEGTEEKSTAAQAKELLRTMSFISLADYNKYVSQVDSAADNAAILGIIKEALKASIKAEHSYNNDTTVSSKNEATDEDVDALTSLDEATHGNLKNYYGNGANLLQTALGIIAIMTTGDAYKGTYADSENAATRRSELEKAVADAKAKINTAPQAELSALGSSLANQVSNFVATQNSAFATEWRTIVISMSFISAERRAEFFEANSKKTQAEIMQNLVSLFKENIAAGNSQKVLPVNSPLDATTFGDDTTPSMDLFTSDAANQYRHRWAGAAAVLIENDDEYRAASPYTTSEEQYQKAYVAALTTLKATVKDQSTDRENALETQVLNVFTAKNNVAANQVSEPVTVTIDSDITDEQKAQARALVARMSYLTPLLRETVVSLIDDTFFMKELVALLQEISRIN
ncbi:MAG: hypothetical protein Q3972_06980, partial [Corynebacterium sp.]|nr:hypothetical protein [Corynebacterium sp.]